MALLPLEINFWDVGQGDCSTITLPNGKLIIIDVGPRGSPLIDWLHDKPRQIHSVVLTHNDSDHVGSLPALLGSFAERIENFWMLVDRPTKSRVFDKTFRCALEAERRGRFQIRRVEAGALIWKGSELNADLLALFPTMSGNVLAPSPNQTSGILALRIGDQTEVLWPADSTLSRVAAVCSGLLPFVMVGPHHGGPSDYRGQDALLAIAKVSPRCAYISVGTKNPYSHPRPKYLQRLERTGCKVICSEITTACDRGTTILNPRPVMPTHLALGLRPPRRGVACRGPWRLRWTGSAFESDGFDDEHLARISLLRRPQCLRGRAFFEAMV